MNGKQPEAVFQDYYTNYFYYYAHYISRLTMIKYVLRIADLCTPILCVTTSLGNIGEAAIAV